MIRRILLFALAMAGTDIGAMGAASAEPQFGVVNLSVCNMRETPDYSAEMVTQALLGTPVHVLETAGWLNIQTPDTYTGWVHPDAVTILTREQYSEWNAAEKVVVTSLFGIVRDGPSPRASTISDVVGGDRLKLLGTKGKYYKVGFPDGREGYLPKKDGDRESHWRMTLRAGGQDIVATALSMLGFPYLWAGMSPKGADCSGFVRTVFWMHDIIIPRDAGPQSREGEMIEIPTVGIGKDWKNLLPGDLVFFGRVVSGTVTEKVNHVGIYIGDGRYIHSLGKVKIASMDPSDQAFDAFTTGRMLFGRRILTRVGKDPNLTTSLSNNFYNE
jgi:SH3-like domain-containing protein